MEIYEYDTKTKMEKEHLDISLLTPKNDMRMSNKNQSDNRTSPNIKMLHLLSHSTITGLLQITSMAPSESSTAGEISSSFSTGCVKNR